MTAPGGFDSHDPRTAMPNQRRRRSRLARALVTAGLAIAVAATTACSVDRPTPVPQPTPSAAVSRVAPKPQTCDNATTSYQPNGLPGPNALPAGSTMARIKERGRLIAGVSGDTFLLGARNPKTGTIEGFDIDMVRAIAQAIFGDATKFSLRVITADDRIPLLKAGEVDVVVRAMTMTCDRWDQVAFSSVYYQAGQKVMVRTDSAIENLADLAGKKVCAPNGTSSIDNLLVKVPKAVVVPATNHTGCLVLFQTGAVDAVTGDDTVLAGLAAQDPYARVLTKEQAFSSEPYGIGMNADQVDLVRFVNARLDQMRSNGEWQASYNKWLAPRLGAAKPPAAKYGR